jgi:hypothetical protein
VFNTREKVEASWNVMAQAQKPDFVFRRNGRVHLNRRGRQFSLAAEVCASAVVMLDTPCSGVVWRVLATQSIRQFPLHFPSRASPCAITFQLDSTTHAGCSFGHTLFITLTHRYPHKLALWPRNEAFVEYVESQLADSRFQPGLRSV